MYVCSCRGVTDTQVKEAVVAGAGSVDDVTRACGAGGGCGGCHDLLARLLAESAVQGVGTVTRPRAAVL